MQAFEMHRYLKECGLVFEREGGRHRIYRLGKNKLAVPRGKNFRNTTKVIIDRFLKEHGAAAGPASKGVVQPTGEEELIVPDTACLNRNFEENTTRLPPGLYEVFKDFVAFCEANSSKAGDYEIRDIMLQIGCQLPDWNSLLYEAKRSEDASVLFDLNDCLELMNLKSIQLQQMLAELEEKTAPRPEETSVQEQSEDFEAAKVVAHGERYPYQPHVPRSRQGAVIAPVQKPQQMEFSQPWTPPPQPANGYSPRQAAYLEVLPILGRLAPEDAKLVLQQLTGFIDLG